MTSKPTLDIESPLWEENHVIVGLDEVGRGAWAGGVSIGACILSPETDLESSPFSEVKDSKLLSKKKRVELAPYLKQAVVAFGVGTSSPGEIDTYGMTEALRLAALRALEQVMDASPTVILLDGPHNYVKHPVLPVKTFVKGDLRILSIATASVIAKVERDLEMEKLGREYPNFAFEKNAGYPSPVHRAALEKYGLTPQHRASWSFAKPKVEQPVLF